jgi:hypothetical protein
MHTATTTATHARTEEHLHRLFKVPVRGLEHERRLAGARAGHRPKPVHVLAARVHCWLWWGLGTEVGL